MNPEAGTDPEVDPDAAPAPDPETEADRIREAFLREAFVREALDVTPGPVPLAAVRRAGLARRRRRTATFSALSVLVVATASAVVAGVPHTRSSLPVPGPVAAPPSVVAPRVPTTARTPTPTRTPTAPPVRTVRPGERVDAGKGWKVWLTAEGKHWVGPDGYENSRSVTDGNVDTAAPGVSHQSEGTAAGVFHSGLYYGIGTRTAGRLELTGAGGRKTLATLLELPDRPGWGVWYAHTGPGEGDVGVALYDRAGKLLADLPG
ncbi:hypothetical protein OG361_18065 [Streptomyces sp. NBC_00090]|uniref:hypothetical protein n=1 Tax=Streptomyces sp. NBC_00090 TaxID=2903619 RepID=UPI00324BF334